MSLSFSLRRASAAPHAHHIPHECFASFFRFHFRLSLFLCLLIILALRLLIERPYDVRDLNTNNLGKGRWRWSPLLVDQRDHRSECCISGNGLTASQLFGKRLCFFPIEFNWNSLVVQELRLRTPAHRLEADSGCRGRDQFHGVAWPLLSFLSTPSLPLDVASSLFSLLLPPITPLVSGSMICDPAWKGQSI